MDTNLKYVIQEIYLDEILHLYLVLKHPKNRWMVFININLTRINSVWQFPMFHNHIQNGSQMVYQEFLILNLTHFKWSRASCILVDICISSSIKWLFNMFFSFFFACYILFIIVFSALYFFFFFNQSSQLCILHITVQALLSFCFTFSMVSFNKYTNPFDEQFLF